MNPDLEREARRLLARYQIEVVERFGLCPWAEPARARGEVRVFVVDADPASASAALDAFVADAGAQIGLVVMPAFDGDARALRRLRDAVLAGDRARVIALAEFHPEAERDETAPARLVPWLRRAPDALLQAVRHETLASLRRTTTTLAPAAQVAAMAGHAAPPRDDPSTAVAATNLATTRAQGDAIAAALDDIARDRAATYAALGVAIRVSTRR